MGVEDAETMLFSALTGDVAVQALENVSQCHWLISGLGSSADSDAVGLGFLAAAVMTQPRAADGVNRGVDQCAQVFAHHVAHYVSRQREQFGQKSLALLPGQVALRDVRDLVREHS